MRAAKCRPFAFVPPLRPSTALASLPVVGRLGCASAMVGVWYTWGMQDKVELGGHVFEVTADGQVLVDGVRHTGNCLAVFHEDSENYDAGQLTALDVAKESLRDTIDAANDLCDMLGIAPDDGKARYEMFRRVDRQEAVEGLRDIMRSPLC